MKTIAVGILLCGAICTASTASAQAVYRCVEKGKPVSFQNRPCRPGATVTGVRAYVPEPTPSANELAWKRYRLEQEMAARNRRARPSAGSGSAVVMPVGGDGCAQAKADRDAWERRVGLGRTIEGMRYWQDHVYRACR
jgi:hypothetical protein